MGSGRASSVRATMDIQPRHKGGLYHYSGRCHLVTSDPLLLPSCVTTLYFRSQMFHHVLLCSRNETASFPPLVRKIGGSGDDREFHPLSPLLVRIRMGRGTTVKDISGGAGGGMLVM